MCFNIDGICVILLQSVMLTINVYATTLIINEGLYVCEIWRPFKVCTNIYIHFEPWTGITWPNRFVAGIIQQVWYIWLIVPQLNLGEQCSLKSPSYCSKKDFTNPAVALQSSTSEGIQMGGEHRTCVSRGCQHVIRTNHTHLKMTNFMNDGGRYSPRNDVSFREMLRSLVLKTRLPYSLRLPETI